MIHSELGDSVKHSVSNLIGVNTGSLFDDSSVHLCSPRLPELWFTIYWVSGSKYAGITHFYSHYCWDKNESVEELSYHHNGTLTGKTNSRLTQVVSVRKLCFVSFTGWKVQRCVWTWQATGQTHTITNWWIEQEPIEYITGLFIYKVHLLFQRLFLNMHE